MNVTLCFQPYWANDQLTSRELPTLTPDTTANMKTADTDMIPVSLTPFIQQAKPCASVSWQFYQSMGLSVFLHIASEFCQRFGQDPLHLSSEVMGIFDDFPGLRNDPDFQDYKAGWGIPSWHSEAKKSIRQCAPQLTYHFPFVLAFCRCPSQFNELLNKSKTSFLVHCGIACQQYSFPDWGLFSIVSDRFGVVPADVAFVAKKYGPVWLECITRLDQTHTSPTLSSSESK